MGVFVDYVLCAECTPEELVNRLERVRQRCLDLPLRAVGQVRRVEAIHNPITISLFQQQGCTLPEAVAQRLQSVKAAPDHGLRCLSFGLVPASKLPKRRRQRYLAPARELIERGEAWNKADLPEEVSEGIGGFTTYSVTRGGIEFEFANILLRYGYMLILDPGEGSETVSLALSTYGQTENRRSRKSPLWYGESFTKTQYARDFIRVHETVCRVLDIVQEEGLLLSASDTCGYYADRTWKEAGKRVNEELTFAKAVSDRLGVEIGNMREEGVQVQVVVDNASKAKPVDFSPVLKHDSDGADAGDAGS